MCERSRVLLLVYATGVPYYALFYDTVDNFVERRQPHRSAHLALVDAAHRDGRIIFAGALKPAAAASGPVSPGAGALLLFRTNDAADVERFAREDPYVVNGLVKSWCVREWSTVVGEGAVPR
jgi:uncharacterized protein YciI